MSEPSSDDDAAAAAATPDRGSHLCDSAAGEAPNRRRLLLRGEWPDTFLRATKRGVDFRDKAPERKPQGLPVSWGSVRIGWRQPATASAAA
jgi:hypothetical protein